DEADLQSLDAQVQALAEQVARDEQASQTHTAQLAELETTGNRLIGQVDETRTTLAEQQARLASEKAMQKAVLREDDSGLRDWLSTQGYGDARSMACAVEAPAEWQTAVEAALGEWLSGFGV